MPLIKEKAILVVSFGSSHEQTIRRTIDQIEHEIACCFSHYEFYRAFTSSSIRAALKQKG